MRQIKFRFWDTQLFKMIDGDMMFINDYSDGGTASLQTTMDGLNDRYETMQFTGLKDENGQEIYEGDIISSKPYLQQSQERIIAQVVFREDLARWDAEGIGEWEGETDHLYEANKSPHDTKVIGNIYENPELLNSEQKDNRSVASKAK